MSIPSCWPPMKKLGDSSEKEQMIPAGVEGAEDYRPRPQGGVDAVFDSVSLGTTIPEGSGKKRALIFWLDFRGDFKTIRTGQEISGHRCAPFGHFTPRGILRTSPFDRTLFVYCAAAVG